MNAITEPPAAHQQKIPARYWRVATLSGMASYLDSGILVGVSVCLAIWAQHYNLSVWVLGSMSAILTVCIAIGSLVGGRLADVFGRKLVYGVDIAIYAIGAIVIVFAPNAPVLFVGIIIAGLAAGADLPTSLAVVSDAVPTWARGRLISFTQTMWILGIMVAIGLGLATSTMGFAGTKIVIGHLAVVAIATWILRSRLNLEDHHTEQELASAEAIGHRGASGFSLRVLLTRSVMIPMLATFGFYVLWGIAANTFGQFGTYFLVTVSGASQTLATTFGLVVQPIGIIMSLVFVRFADSKWRDRIFFVAAALQIVAFLIGAISAGATLGAMLIFYILYNLVNPFAGETSYKVWSQLLFPPDIRGTAQGLTYAVARGVFAIVALFTPAILAWNPSVLLWGLVVCIAGSSVIGGITARYLIPHAPAVVLAGVTLPPARTPAR